MSWFWVFRSQWRRDLQWGAGCVRIFVVAVCLSLSLKMELGSGRFSPRGTGGGGGAHVYIEKNSLESGMGVEKSERCDGGPTEKKKREKSYFSIFGNVNNAAVVPEGRSSTSFTSAECKEKHKFNNRAHCVGGVEEKKMARIFFFACPFVCCVCCVGRVLPISRHFSCQKWGFDAKCRSLFFGYIADCGYSFRNKQDPEQNHCV